MSVHLPGTIRTLNKEIVLNIIKDAGPLSRSEIAKKSGITKATISEIVKELIEDQLIFDEKDENDTSKRGTRLHFAKKHFYGLAIDLGGTSIHFSVFNIAVQSVYEKTVKTYHCESSKLFLEKLISDIQQVILDSRINITNLSFISIATPGIVDYRTGIIVEGSPNLPEWRNINIKKTLYEVFKLPIIVENDVRAALIGEMYAGECKDVNSAILIGIGTGLGSAILIDGKIIRGSGNAAGEIGYMLFNPDQLNMPSNKGHYETICSGSGIDMAYYQITGEKIDTSTIFKRAQKDDIQAAYILDNFINYLAIGILNMISIVNPEKIVLMGGMTNSTDLFLNKVKQKVTFHSYNTTRTNIVVSKLQHKSALYGTALLGLNEAFPSLKYVDNKQLY